jgi:hypothetical protein
MACRRGCRNKTRLESRFFLKAGHCQLLDLSLENSAYIQPHIPCGVDKCKVTELV